MATALTSTLALVVTGCGKSVVDTTAQAPASAAVQAGGSTDTGAAPAAAAPAAAPAAGAGAAPVAAAPATGTAAAPAAAAPAAVPAAAGAPASTATAAKTKGKQAAAAPTQKGKGSAPAAAQEPAASGVAAVVQKYVQSQAIFGGNGACVPASLSPITIANVSTLSGVIGELFGPVRPALQVWAASQNACGGLNGHKINLVILDDGGDPATAAQKAEEAVDKYHAMAMTGNIEVLTVDALAPVVKRAGMPVIGGDITGNTWFTNPLFFPQSSGGQSESYGYVVGAAQYHQKKKFGDIYCIEVPRSCEQVDRAFTELAPKLGGEVIKTTQSSITAPSYIQQCLDFKNAGVEVVTMTMDSASQNRIARSCQQVGYNPKVVSYALTIQEGQFFGPKNTWLGDDYVPINGFPWMAGTAQFPGTPAMQYYQRAVAKYNPGFTTGDAASLGWTSAALLTAASANLSAQNPTREQLEEGLWAMKGQLWTQLGGLASPLHFNKGGLPQNKYCLTAAISNKEQTGWAKVITDYTCTDIIAPSDPQARLKGQAQG